MTSISGVKLALAEKQKAGKAAESQAKTETIFKCIAGHS